MDKYLESSAGRIRKIATSHLKRLKQEEISEIPILREYLDIFLRSLYHGKAIRGTLVTLGYELGGGTLNKAIVDVAAAYEVAHSGLLVQDDFMDKDLLRRGKPSIYQALGADHFADSQATCIGDIGLILAEKIIAESGFASKVKNKAQAYFSEVILKTVLGQMLDVHFSYKGRPDNEKQILEMYQLKTAQYTIVGPLTIGAILAYAKPSLVKTIKVFGENLGTAFQIQDDILGIFGDEKISGKSVISDIKEGKNTLLFFHAYSSANLAEKKLLSGFYGNDKITIEQSKTVREILRRKSLAYCRSVAKSYADKARECIPDLTNDKRQVAILTGLCDFLINRKY